VESRIASFIIEGLKGKMGDGENWIFKSLGNLKNCTSLNPLGDVQHISKPT